MKRVRRPLLRIAGVAVLVAAFTQVVEAQDYPTRPLTMVVPYAAGGPSDTIGRLVAEGMRASLGQPVIIENVTGASGTIGVARAVRAPADGYTLSLGGWGSHVLNGAIFTAPHDVLNDFEPVALLGREPLLIIGTKSAPARDLKEFIAWLKKDPGKMSLGTTGPGGALHVAGVFFENETGTSVQPVPYRGGAGAAMQDLVAGRIHMMINLSASALPQVRSGTIKAYAVTANERLKAAPDIPTVDEAGLPGFHVWNWHGLWVPKGTPKDVIARLNAAVTHSLNEPAIRRRLADLGQEFFPQEQQTPDALRAFHKAEIEKWWPIVRAAGIKAD